MRSVQGLVGSAKFEMNLLHMLRPGATVDDNIFLHDLAIACPHMPSEHDHYKCNCDLLRVIAVFFNLMAR